MTVETTHPHPVPFPTNANRRLVAAGDRHAYLDERVFNVTNPYYGVVPEDNPVTDFGAAVQAAIDDAAAVGGGDVLIPGKVGVEPGTVSVKEGVRLLGVGRPVDKASAAAHTGSWLVALAGSGAVVTIGRPDQTVSVRNAGLSRLGIDGGDQAGATCLALGSNSRTSPAYVTTALDIDRFVLTRAGVGLQWGSGETAEQVDGVEIAMGEINSMAVTGMRVDGSNCGDFSILREVRFIACSDIAGEPWVDLVNGGALTLDNCFAGGDGTGTKDFIRVATHNGLRLVRVQSEKMRYFLRLLSSFSNDNVEVTLDGCYIDDPISMEGTARIHSIGSQIKAAIFLSGTGAKWDGDGDTVVGSSGGRAAITGNGAVFHGSHAKRATANSVYVAGEEYWEQPAGSGTPFEKVGDRVVRGGRKATAWVAATVYSGAVERSWVASTAYVVGGLVTPTWGNGVRYRCTIAGTSGATEPLWSRQATAAVYTDGTCTWVYDALTTTVSATSYAEPTTPNGHVYKLVTAGTSGATTEPVWPTTSGATVTDGTATWQETGVSALLRPQVAMFGDRGGAIPVSGYFERGHIRWNDGPDPGDAFAWECTASGTPGTWRAMGYLVNHPVGSAYTASNVTTDRSFDADTVATPELADVVGTLIADLKLAGVIL